VIYDDSSSDSDSSDSDSDSDNVCICMLINGTLTYLTYPTNGKEYYPANVANVARGTVLNGVEFYAPTARIYINNKNPIIVYISVHWCMHMIWLMLSRV